MFTKSFLSFFATTDRPIPNIGFTIPPGESKTSLDQVVDREEDRQPKVNRVACVL
jgi:hypothetical protein